MSIYGLIPDRDVLGSPQEHLTRGMEFLNRAHHFDETGCANKIAAAVAHFQAGLLAHALQDEPPADGDPQTHQLRIFHNVSAEAEVGYDEFDAVVEVADYSITTRTATEELLLLRQCLLAFTIAPAYAGDVSPELRELVDDYRHRGNRRLAIGDVIALGDRFWAVDQTGWKSVDPPVQIRRSLRGTTPLHQEPES